MGDLDAMALCMLWTYLHGEMCTVGEACVLHVDYLPTLTATQQAQHTTRDAHSVYLQYSPTSRPSRRVHKA